MATWGTKTFEDDTATDWLLELIDAEESRDFLLENITISEDQAPGYDTGVPEKAQDALKLVLTDDSELIQTWKDQDDYEEWREGVDELVEIMEQLVEA